MNADGMKDLKRQWIAFDGVSAACDLFGGYAKEEVMKRAFPVPAQRCLITKAECGDDAGLLGAALLAFQKREPDFSHENAQKA